MKEDFLKYLYWSIGTALWSTVCFVIPDFIDNPIANISTALSVCAYILSVVFFHFLLIYLIGINRYVCAALLPIYGLIGATCSYYRLFYHVSITPLLVDAALHTTTQEAAGVVSIGMIIWLTCNVIIGTLLASIRFRKLADTVIWWSYCGVFLIAIAYYMAIPRLKEGLDSRFPLNVIRSISECIKEQHRQVGERQIPLIQTANTPDSIFVIAILGESARSDHMQLNGYNRPTNPLLSLESNIVSLSHIYSPYTNTTKSIPHIITRADSLNPDFAHTETSFITLFRQQDFKTMWLSNQNLAGPLYDFLHETDTTLYTSAAIKQSLYSQWLDEELLPMMDSFIGTQPKQLIVLHTVGSHWLYDTHVSDEVCLFLPCVANRDIRQNSQEQIINSYDNTIIYLDAFIEAVISRLKTYPAIVMYLSDHGESLGEEGRYLHSQENAPEEQYPAAVVWFSDSYQALFPEKIKALQKNSQRNYRTDYYFYSILSAAGIEAEGNNSSVDIFR